MHRFSFALKAVPVYVDVHCEYAQALPSKSNACSKKWVGVDIALGASSEAHIDPRLRLD